MQIKTYSSKKDISDMSSLCLQHRLYVEGWTMRVWYWNPEHIEKLIICFEDNKPIASLVLVKSGRYNLGIFVHPDYRRRGYGTAMMKRIFRSRNIDLYKCCGHFVYQRNFFYKVKNSIDNPVISDKVLIS